ncbi:MAG: gliding motility-associated C-terminal domain-containing protein [Ferruginibacter sp.]
MIRYLLFSLCMMLGAHSFSQNWNNKIWYFGSRGGINFNTNPATAIGNSAMGQSEGTSTMCDVNGNILFYTNGINVWNRNHQVMPNGSNLHGHPSATQSALILKLPGSDHIYYIFTVSAYESSQIQPSAFTIVDLTLNGGLGDVTVKNYPLHMRVTEKLTATLKANGTDYWIITKEAGTDAFYVYSFSAATQVDAVPVISHAGNVTNSGDYVGYARVSPNGSKLALANWSNVPSQLFDFDNNTGRITNPIELPHPYPTYGVEFSPDNSKLYIMQQRNGVLRQYDLLAGSATAIQNSVTQIASLDSPMRGAAIMLGPDDKIYICEEGKSYVSVVNQPNLSGAACGYVFNALPLTTGTGCAFGLTNNLYYVDHATGCPQQVYSSHNVFICPGQTYQMQSGLIVNTPGTYQDTLRNAAHCDSIITIINLQFVHLNAFNVVAHSCSNNPYILPSGTIPTATGIYDDTTRSVAGCDSIIVHLDLTYFETTVRYDTFSVFVCSNTLPYHLPSGTIVTHWGTYNDTIRNVNGCDSVVSTVTVGVSAFVSYSSTTAQLCPGGTYTLPNGTVVSVPGTYFTDTVRTVGTGCDSIIHFIQLRLLVASYRDVYIRTCANQPYQLPSGTIVTGPGNFSDTLRSRGGCDSIITRYHLSILLVTHLPNLPAQICSGQSYHLPSGTVVNTAGVYIDTVRAVGGCDSVIRTITLTVVPASLVNTAAQICSGQSYHLPSGHNVNTTGVYSDTLRSVSGCDSIITTVTLSVIPGSYINTAAQICSGQTYTLSSGTVVNTAGTYYVDTIRSVTGCDSIIHTVTLSVFPVSHVNTTAQICSGQVYHLPSGAIVNTTGIYADTTRSVNTCDSIITIVNLSVVTTNILNTAAQICSGQTYTLPSGTIINTAGVYTDTLRSVIGCDSVITTTTLSVVPGSYVNTNVLICSGQTYTLPSGTIVNTAGIYYTDTLRSIAGCDSIIHSTTLSVFPVSHANATGNICAGQTYILPSGTIINAAGFYSDTIRSVNNCDSIITSVNLSVLIASHVNTAVQVCSNQTYTLPSGTVVSTAGVYIDTLRSIGGCDSVITNTTLSVFPVNHVSNAIQICSGQTYTLPSGTIVSITGVYIDTLRSVVGCDSIITSTNLSVITTSVINTSTQICSNQTYALPSGTIVSTAGNYIDTVRSAIGCDSIITHLTLSVFPVQFLNTEVHICSNETYHLPSGTIVHTAGTYIDTLRSIGSCDSIINTIHLFINDVSSTNITDSIFAGQTYTLPSGAVVSAAGVYESVLVNSVGCDSVITTTLKLKQKIIECITLKNAFTPNGDGVNDYWILYRYNCFKRLEVNVYNRYGSIVYHSDNYKNDWNGKFKNQELPDGTYYYIIKVISFDGKEHLFKDNVTILR